MSFQYLLEDGSGNILLETGEGHLLLEIAPSITPITVVAPVSDPAGAALLAGIVLVQDLVQNTNSPFAIAQLGLLQVNAVDHFMAKFFVTAASILATIAPVRVDARAAKMLAEIAGVEAKIAAYVPPSAAEFLGNEAQYSVQYVPTFLQQKLNELQTQLVDYYMATGAIPAALILSTMTGVQTLDDNGQPVVYVGTYTWYGLPEC
jgi:hypothetical protein